MTKREFTYPSRNGTAQIHAVEWLPEGEITGVLQISHGVAEYIERYEPFVRFLTEGGIAVAGNDHLGHGLSVEPGGPRLYFGPKGSWQSVVDDLYTLYGMEKKRFPGLPYFLLGHSMGSFLARTYLIRYPGTVDGAIVMGTGQMVPPMVAAGRAVAAAEGRRVGWDKMSPVVEKLAFGAYNKVFAPNRTEYDWLSVNEENVDAYIADELCGGNATVGLFREMLGGIRFITDRDNLRRMNMNTPILFLSGEKDPVGECGRGVRRAYESFRRAGVRQVELKLYPGLRHEILNESCREDVYGDILRWLKNNIDKIRMG
ncbi:lysophospholipase [Oscillibacter sp. MSJ-2]|uniref:Lysophospholipase n=1 Tax=Dysosmobacter acutus TaxID=2841504 RepID=A0ABS6F7P2_9FIRM|nr:alpha/beta hydrolase [Dysosmobacter acutus]MBU5626299.1 lysophospholipase [Dysosmobacter acutus]